MKRFIGIVSALLLLSTLLVTTSAHAQFGIRAGIRAGSNFTGSSSAPTTSGGSTATGTNGLILGAILEKSWLGPVDLQVEFLYTQRKFEDDLNTDGTERSWFQKLDYVQIPITGKLTTPVGFGLKGYAFAGPNFGYKVSASTTTDTTGSSQTSSEGGLFNDFDLGVDIGGGLEYQIAPLVSIIADLRYTYGLVDVFNHYVGDNQSELKSRDVKVMGGLLFGF